MRRAPNGAAGAAADAAARVERAAEVTRRIAAGVPADGQRQLVGMDFLEHLARALSSDPESDRVDLGVGADARARSDARRSACALWGARVVRGG